MIAVGRALLSPNSNDCVVFHRHHWMAGLVLILPLAGHLLVDFHIRPHVFRSMAGRGIHHQCLRTSRCGGTCGRGHKMQLHGHNGDTMGPGVGSEGGPGRMI